MSTYIPLSARGNLGNKRPRDDDKNVDHSNQRSPSIKSLHTHSWLPERHSIPPHIALLDLGSAITDVLTFLRPADQHKLRCTSSAMCEWFDSAAENGSLAFYLTFVSLSSRSPLRWKHAAGNPRGRRPKLKQITVTVHVRNYYLSTYNTQARGKAALADDAIIECAAIRLVAGFSFEHKLVITGLFGIRSIGDDFCKGVRATEIKFKGEDSQLRSVGNGWMTFCRHLRSITFSGFAALEEVGNDWLSYCSSLESVAFAADMPNLKEVGNSWMSSCKKLKSVTFAGFTTLEKVGHDWLAFCSSLESIAFVNGLAKRKHVDLTGFIALEEVGNGWLSFCSSLKNIAFAGDIPKRLKRVGGWWMACCLQLKNVDLAAFTALEEVGGGWMYDCSSLEHVAFASDMPNLTRVGRCWMCGCSKMKNVDLTGFAALEEVGGDWLRACFSLERFMLPAQMPKLERVGFGWTPQSECSLSDHLLYLSKSRQ